MYKTLSLLHGLRDVRLGIAQSCDEVMLDLRCFRDTLEEFATRSCWDRDIQRHAKYCKSLRCIDTSICRSKCVSDRVADYVSMFEQFEELNLCEVSSLCEDALQTALKGLAEDEMPKSEDFQVSTDEASPARNGKFRYSD